MKTTHIILTAVLAAASALAQPNVAWVASYGTDTNILCARTSPCRTFNIAVALVAAGGIVKAIDAADYGPVNVYRTVTIDGSGVGAMIEVVSSGGAGITATANPSNFQLTIKDLTIHIGANVTGYGIFTDVDTYIENVLITGAPFIGVNSSSNVNGAINLSAKNLSVIGATEAGLYAGPGQTSIRDSVFQAPGGEAVFIHGNSPFPANALIERCEMSGSFAGLYVTNQSGGPSAIARVSDSVITGNSVGITTAFGGQIVSFRTNMIAGNGTDGSTAFSTSLK